MSLRIVDATIETEQSDDLHEARLMLLLRHAANRKNGSIDGITKLAKIDFLLRYPIYFQRMADKLNESRKVKINVPLQEYEIQTVESKMIRFRYGPWDPRYRRWIGILVARGLADTYLAGKTVHVKLTERGINIAKYISETEGFQDLDERSKLISKIVGAKSGTWLKETIYEIVPELTGMKWGNEIQP